MHNFRKALRTTLLFLLIVALGSAGVMAFFFEGENYFYQTASNRTSYAGEINYAFIGASHCNRGFVPEIIDEELDVCSYNYSSMSITMQGRYELLKKEIARNPIKTVIFEVSLETMRFDRDSIGPEGDFYMLGELDSPFERLSYFFKTIRPSEYGQAYFFFMNNGKDCLQRYFDGIYKKRNESPYLHKGYKAYECEEPGFNTTKLDYKKTYENRRTDELKINKENIEYMDKIVSLCEENDIELIMVTVPVSDYRIAKYQFIEDSRKFHEAYAIEHNIDFYDFNLLKDRNDLFSDDKDFQDDQHLYNTGAVTFSSLFGKLMKAKSEGKDISSYFYDTYPEYESTQSYSQ